MRDPQPQSAQEILEREFLEARAKLLQLAANFDRLDRAPGSVAHDPRLVLIQRGLAVLSQSASADRAEQIQQLFSRPYDEKWREKYFSQDAKP